MNVVSESVPNREDFPKTWFQRIHDEDRMDQWRSIAACAARQRRRLHDAR